MATIRIATRRSPLAMWQAHFVKKQLESYHPNLVVELVPMVTRGDKILDTPLAKIGGKGLFVKELEVAMLEHRADIAVHSMKDVPAEFPAGLELHTICEREDPSDAFVSNEFKRLDDLPKGAVVGTASLRRQCQLLAMRPDLTIKSLRGNVGTRLSKLDQGEYQAIILASAGLKRLELAERITESISADKILPAAGQGAVGIECRSDDETTKSLLAPLHHKETAMRVIAERAVNHTLEGGCQVPIGAYSIVKGDQLELSALVGEIDGSKLINSQISGQAEHAGELGRALGQALLKRGAGEIISALYASQNQ